MNNYTRNIYILSRVKGVGPATLNKLINAGYNSIEDLANGCNAEELKKYIKGGNQVEAIESILDYADQHIELISIELDHLKDLSIEIFSKWDDQYPIGYTLIKDAPIFIYSKGNHELLKWKDNIALVGSRNCSEAGIAIANNTARYFSENNYNIISGLAKGIDSAGHIGALKAKEGKTTAVVIDVEQIFPQENQYLADKIINSGGLIISENPPGTTVAGNLFVRRNRLQSGLAIATFVIEAGINSGTMHTVKFAREQNRLIFIPDIKKNEDFDSYSDSRKGMPHLMAIEGVETFTNESYKNIINKLNKKKIELFSKKSTINEAVTGKTEKLF